MSKLTIDDAEVFIHPVQNVVMISSPLVTKKEVNNIIVKIAKNKKQYGILDEGLPFDVFQLKGQRLLLRQYDESGNLDTNILEKTIADDGMFAGKFTVSDSLESSFDCESTKYTLERIQLEDFAKLNEADQINTIAEVEDFIRDNFSEHLTLWDLHEHQPHSEELTSHFRAVLDSMTDVYFIRNAETQELVAMSGISVIDKLAYISLTVTKEDLRNKGMMRILYQHIANDYPEVTMTIYTSNPIMKELFGEEGMVKANKAKEVSELPQLSFVKQTKKLTF